MAETEFLAIGDLHLEKLVRIFPDSDHLAPQLKVIADVLDYSRSEGIKRNVFLGDLCETPFPQQRTIRRLIETVKDDRDCENDWIRGNHDTADSEANSMEIFQALADMDMLKKNRVHLSPKLADFDGVPVYFMSYPYHKIEKTEYEKIVFCHLEYSGAIRDNGSPVHGGIEVPKRDKIIAGHLHRHQRIGDSVYYPGTMMQMNFGEPLPKGFFHVRAESKRGKIKLNCQFVQYEPPYTLVNAIIKDKNDLKEIKTKQSIRYKLFLQREVEIPDTWLMDHPNVVKIEGYSRSKELKKLQEGEPTDDQVYEGFDPTERLEAFMKTRGLDKDERARGHRFIEKIMSSRQKHGGA